nr:MAG TPA: hypothetical protein [Caudoviricetes sp.]
MSSVLSNVKAKRIACHYGGRFFLFPMYTKISVYNCITLF